MKPFILVALLCVLCSSQPSRNDLSPEDFGAYLVTDQNGKREIVIRSNYYVTEGKPDDLKAAKLGIDFWNNLSGQFILLEMDSTGKLTDEYLPIRFELKIETCNDPLSTQKLNDSLGRNKIPGAVILNTFLLVDTIENDVDGCRVKNPGISAGLTCKASFTRVKLHYKDSVKVIAHEIGHTLGLLDMERKEALMHEDTSGGIELYEFEIRKILDHAYGFKANWFRNHFDPSIPEGDIVHISARDRDWQPCSSEFLKSKPQKDKKRKRK